MHLEHINLKHRLSISLLRIIAGCINFAPNFYSYTCIHRYKTIYIFLRAHVERNRLIRIQRRKHDTNRKPVQTAGGLPAGVKFDPTDQELLEHLEAKARPGSRKLHPLIDDYIPTIEGDDGICYTHPERLPGKNFIP